MNTRIYQRWPMFAVASLCAVAAVSAACGQPLKTPVQAGPGTSSAARQYLEGRWALVSFEVFQPGREPIRLKGSGELTYDAYGNLKMDVLTDVATGEALAKAGIPVQGSRLASDGRVSVDMQSRTLTYVIQGQPPLGAPSGPLALNRPRHWEVNGTLLTLTTRDDAGQPASVSRWQKVP